MKKQKTKQEKQSNKSLVDEIITRGDIKEVRALFAFKQSDSDEEILMKFNLWSRYFFFNYFKCKDAPFHRDIDLGNLNAYRGDIKYFIDIAFRGASKRQPLDAKILTPKGWTTMGELNVGDYVVGSNGKPTKVEFISEIVDRPVYKLETADGRRTECDSEHLWTVRKTSNVKNKTATINTQQMIDTRLYYKRTDHRYPGKEYKEFKYALETVKPIEFTEKSFEVEPYLLGVLIGDGCLCNKHGAPKITFHKDDENHYREIFKKEDCGKTWYDQRNLNVGTMTIKSVTRKTLTNLKIDVKSYNKFIPKEYLLGTVEQRQSVLEGLMDTDGTVGKRIINGGNTPTFSTVSEQLADDVVSLVRSLGGRAYKAYRKNNYNGYYTVSMMFTDYKPFRLKRKLDLCGVSKHTFSPIVNIELIGNKLGRCIRVSNQDGLYVTDDYLLTHNTSRTKLFLAYAIANDEEHYRKYIKVLSKDLKNSRQITTDIYNMFIQPRVRNFYPEIFQKSELKREETMASFTTSFGVKITAGTVGMEQRGNLQDDARPDLILFEDIETRNTLRSAVETSTIFQNMEEARTGLSREGSAIYNANYLSERGNVHKLVTWTAENKRVLIVPIYTREKGIAWEDAYTLDDIKKIKAEADDFAGEYLCEPSLGVDVYFDRASLDKQIALEPIKEISDFKIFHKFDPSHRYGGGMDISGGVGLDSSTSVFIDFSTMPNKVVATYKSNTIKPDVFGDEIARQGEMYGEALVAPENNNHGHATIGRLKQIYSNIFTMEQLTDTAEITPKKSRTYGWSTNRMTKPDMLMDTRKAIEDGHLELTDPDIIAEFKSYTRGDMMDAEVDPRLATRHFDLVVATCIAWKMRHFATSRRMLKEDNYSTVITEMDLEVY